jgi:hypothetical protein
MAFKNKTKWWIGAILLTAFLGTFFMDLTGLELHQWLGVFAGILALYHLLTHLDWVNAVADRFFNGTNTRSRLYLLFDILIACGFGFLVGTGLLMSTWLQINLLNYNFWLLFHILFSIGTLVLVFLKLAFHWRWIAMAIRKPKSSRTLSSAKLISTQTPANASLVGRREFLGIIGVLGLGTLVTATSALKALLSLQDSQAIVLDEGLLSDGQSGVTTSTNASTSLSATESTPTITPNTTTGSATPTSNEGCVVRCNNHCSYPGRCRRYVDLNRNNLCENGEGLGSGLS